MKILYLVRSVLPYWSNRIDVDYIITALLKNGHEVFIYDIKQRMLLNCKSEERKYYLNLPKILDSQPFNLLINFLFFQHFLKKTKGRFDFYHIFYVREEQRILSSQIRRVAPKLFLTIYGSDINIKNFVKNRFKKLFLFADLIIATNQSILDKVAKENIQYKINNKTRVLMLPQIRFSQYENFTFEDKKSAKEKLGYEKYNKVIIIGTSAAEYEQHFEIINELSKIEKSNILFVFPLTYGAGNFVEYRLRVKKYLEEKVKQNDYIILLNYLNEEELADLRKASDILINLRKNDQLVASMFESFLVGTDVITGSWLPYQIFDEIGISYFKIKSISELVAILKEMIKFDITKRKKYFLRNRNMIQAKYPIDKNLSEWLSIYSKD